MIRRFISTGALVTWSTLVLGWLLCVLALASRHTALLGWDEVDYVRAAELGFKANALEDGSLTIREFVRLAAAKRTTEGSPLPGNYDEARDPLLLRHYHPPFVVYLLSFAAPSASERVLRSVQLLGAVCLVTVALLGYRMLTRSPSLIGGMAVVALSCWAVPHLFETISFHGWMAVWLTLAPTLLVRCVDAPADRSRWLSLGIACGLSILTLEMGAVVVVAVLLALVLCSGRKLWAAAALRGPALMLAAAVLTVAAMWPGSILKASMVKIPAFHWYRMGLGLEYASVAQRMLATVGVLAPGLGAGALAVAVLARSARLRSIRWLPHVVVGVAYLLCMLPVALHPIYLVPGVTPFAVLVGLATDRARGAIKVAVVILIVICTATLSRPRSPGDASARRDMEWLAETLRGRRAFVDGGHIYRYYLPGVDVHPVSLDYSGQRLYERIRGEYRPFGVDEWRGSVVVLQRHRPGIEDSVLARRLGAACRRADGQQIILYDCE